MTEVKKQNFFVGNDAHWDDIYNENEKVEKHTVVLTISSILDLISSISGLLFVFILKYNDINHFLTIIIYFAIVAKIVCAIYSHFYYQNLSIVSKVYE